MPIRARTLGRPALFSFVLLVSAACTSGPAEGVGASGDDGGSCMPRDSNGQLGSGTPLTFLLTVDDTGFTLGSRDAGSSEPNVTMENRTMVTLTLTNAGSRPHDLVVRCLPTPNVPGCPPQSCFPDSANVPPLDPGKSTTIRFTAPFPEGVYPFTSDLPGDESLQGGQFVLT